MKILSRTIQKVTIFSFIRILFNRKPDFPENFLFFNTGRGATKWLLSYLRSINSKDLIAGMPAYSCYSVHQAVSESGNKIVLLDIDPFCFSLSNELIDQLGRLDLLLWINFFGFKYNRILNEIRVRFPDLIIVEDCSHVDLRDYMKVFIKESYSDYSIFSFNFEKPVTSGGGGLLITHENNNRTLVPDLHIRYKQLPYEKLTPGKLSRILKYQIGLIYRIFSFFKERKSVSSNQSFKPAYLTINSLSMNRIIRKLVYSQFLKRSDKRKSEKYTSNYFNAISELRERYCYGSLSYYPVSSSAYKRDEVDKNIDTFILWRSFVEQYNYFGIDIPEEDFPLTFNFISGSVFMPPDFFNKPNSGNIVFPLF